MMTMMMMTDGDDACDDDSNGADLFFLCGAPPQHEDAIASRLPQGNDRCLHARTSLQSDYVFQFDNISIGNVACKQRSLQPRCCCCLQPAISAHSLKTFLQLFLMRKSRSH
eukprot:11198892-Lingulodinium_polyedra.AAC.1